MPGQHVVLFNTLDLNVVTHEQGHNLGLPHASSRECTNAAGAAMTWSSKCNTCEYGDEIDTMGNRRAGHYNAWYKSRLGWLQRLATVTSTRTVRLTPYETNGTRSEGDQAAGRRRDLLARVPDADRGRPGDAAGHGRRPDPLSGRRPDRSCSTPGRGARPGTTTSPTATCPPAAAGPPRRTSASPSSGQTAPVATVAIKFRAGRPRAPRAPTSVRAQALVRAARITWRRPADNGAIIRRYVITRSGGGKRTVARFAGLPASYTWSGLNSNVSYRFSVRAVNQAGASAAATSPAVRPLTDKPSVVINSPANGATVRGVVPIRITATPNACTRSPIQYVRLVRRRPRATTTSMRRGDRSSGTPRAAQRVVHDPRQRPRQRRTGRQRHPDRDGEQSDADGDDHQPERRGRAVRRGRRHLFMSPRRTGTGSRSSSYVDDSWAASAEPGQPLTLDTAWFGAGPHTLQVRAYDDRFEPLRLDCGRGDVRRAVTVRP